MCCFFPSSSSIQLSRSFLPLSSLVYMRPVGLCPSELIWPSFVHLAFPVCKKLLNGTTPHGDRHLPHAHLYTPPFPLNTSTIGSAWAISDLKHPIISHSIAGGRHGERLVEDGVLSQLPHPLTLQLPVLIAGPCDDEGLVDEKEGYFYPGCWSPY